MLGKLSLSHVPDYYPASRFAFSCDALDLVNRAIRQRRADILAAADGPPLYLEYRLGRALALGLESIEHVHNIDHFPKPIRHASGHRWANPQRLVKPNEIAVHRVQRDRARMIFDLV